MRTDEMLRDDGSCQDQAYYCNESKYYNTSNPLSEREASATTDASNVFLLLFCCVCANADTS